MSAPGTDLPPERRRGGPSFADLFRSLVPLTLLVLLAVWLFSPDEGPQVPTVDPGPALAGASRVVDFPLLAAEGLPAGWRATSAALTPTEPTGPHTVRVGYLTSADSFAQVVQSDLEEADVLVAFLGERSGATGPVELAGQTWEQRTTADGELALLRTVDGVTVLVTGSVDAADLAVLVEALRPFTA